MRLAFPPYILFNFKRYFMLIIPAIDLKDGNCVRLRQGQVDQQTVYSHDPASMAQHWQEAGASWLHVVDLDGAFQKQPVNVQAVAAIRRRVTIPIQLGGGLRELDHLKLYFDMGIDRLILGTVVLKQRQLAEKALQLYPGRVAIALDARDGKLAAEGWVESSQQEAVAVAQELQALQPAAYIYTDINRDGMQTGPNLAATRRLAQAVTIPVIASGGVSSLEDIANLLPLTADGVIGVITGKALYAGTLNYREALALVAAYKAKTEK